MDRNSPPTAQAGEGPDAQIVSSTEKQTKKKEWNYWT
jgi:hypothetical protein